MHIKANVCVGTEGGDGRGLCYKPINDILVFVCVCIWWYAGLLVSAQRLVKPNGVVLNFLEGTGPLHSIYVHPSRKNAAAHAK